jgi:hypothetical protein
MATRLKEAVLEYLLCRAIRKGREDSVAPANWLFLEIPYTVVHGVRDASVVGLPGATKRG